VDAPKSGENGAPRSQDQVEHERVMGEVSDVLLNLEHSLERARKALRVVAKADSEPNVRLALAQAVKDLERTRRQLMQDAYFGNDVLRLM
jgi:hypothetical protein